MLMIRLEEVTKENFDAVLQLQIALTDQRRVASVEYSLAQAWLYREQGTVMPYAVRVGKKVIGFIQLFRDEVEQSLLIWRLLIDQASQHQGYGQEVIRQVLALAQQDEQCRMVKASYVIGNHKMRYILEKLGFQSDGMTGHEINMVLRLQ